VWVDDHLTAAREAITMRPRVILPTRHGAAGCTPEVTHGSSVDQKGWCGVRRAVDILANELVRTLQLLGADSVGSLEPAHVRLRP